MKCTERTAELQALVSDCLERYGVTQREAAKELGVSDGQLSLWRNGKYSNGDIPKLEARIEAWLADREMAASLCERLPEAPEWVATPSGQEIYETLNFGYLMSSQVLVYGAPGMGKTMTCEYFQRRHSNVWLLTPTTVTGTKKGILGLLCQALRCSMGRVLSDAQGEAIAKMRGTRGLIIIDEGQQMAANAMDLMRQVAEAAQVGLAYVGNEGVFAQMSGGSRAMRYAQIYSRNTRRKQLIHPELADVQALAASMGVEDREVVQFLYGISSTPGALRSVVKVLQLAGMSAGGAGGATLKMVKAAWRELMGGAA